MAGDGYTCQLFRHDEGLHIQYGLQVPIQVNGHTIFWIDSKATFGSDYMHWCGVVLSVMSPSGSKVVIK